MSDTSRRNFLAVAGAGAAAAGTVVVTGGAARAAAEARLNPDSAQETVVAYVQDHRSSVVRLMVGEREVVVDDRDLATRILNAAGGK